MSIVYELVKQMNGTIDVNSKPGEGTTFTVKLAFKTVDPAWKKKEIQEENRNITGMNILAAEDNQLNMEILQFLLEEAGAKVTAVSDGKQAVEYFADAASGTYDVILMDIMMPVMDGLEASKKIRELPEGKGKDIPIIAMTANAFVEDKEKTKEAGMNAHLTKPVNREEIIRVLAAYWKIKVNEYMREFWKKAIQVLLYGGLEKEQYKRISAEINEANRKSIVVLSTHQ